MSSNTRKRGRPPKSDQPQNKMVLRVDLEEELQKDFYQIKKEQGLANNTEVLRFCIREMSSNRLYRIPSGIYNLVEELVKDNRIQEKYFVTSVADFINRALQLFINKANTDRSNLYDLSFRSSLDTISRDITNTLIEIQTQNPQWGCKLEEIQKELPDLKKNEIEAILASFIDRKLVKTMEYKKETYYFALDRGYLTEKPIGEL
ncbi:MAG: hypothetical protein ACXAC7_03895 [Candidatus Hodarchaeales archaeon]